MNKIKSILYVAMIAMIAAFTACSEDGYWDAYTEPKTATADGGVYSFAQAKSVNSLDATDSCVVLMINRSRAGAAVTLPITAEVSDEKLICPDSITFEAGKASAEYVIRFNVGDLVIGESYTATIALPDSLTSVSGNTSCAVSISLNYNWISLGTGKFIDNFIVGNDELYDVEILQAEGFPIYRVVDPYTKGLADALAAGSYEPEEIGKPASYFEFSVDKDGLVFYDDFATGWLYKGGADNMVYALHPSAAYDDPEQWQHNCEIDEGVFQLAPYYYVYSLGGGFNYTQYDGVIYIYLPSAVEEAE